jgi:hypothetical protein
MDDPKSTDQNSLDWVNITGTDTHITVGAVPLHGQSYAAWAADHHTNDVKPNVPAGCDGGDPTTWPVVLVGGQTGHLDQLCNAAEVSLAVGDEVYMFGWSNDTFSTASHLPEAQFFRVLESVMFAGAAPGPSPSN